MTNFIKDKKIWILLVLIFILGTFLRTYHFSDWMHFELDQSRDAKVIDLALEEGASNLPLLGPKAAGSFLRLGPVFYYLEYLSAKIFGGTPPGMVALSLIFSCLTILVFYFFAKRYFQEKISLSLTFIFSVSLFLIMYSRFGWNPNNMPFFTLLTFWSLLKLSDSQEKKRGLWPLLFAFSLGIVTQLHFLAFMAVPTISVIFLIWKRPRINWKYWLGAFLVLLVLYTPVIINDFKTGGDNIKEFTKTFEKKTETGEDSHTLIEKGFKDLTENSLGYSLVLTGQGSFELPRLKTTPYRDFICDQGCRDGIIGGVGALIFFILGSLLLILKTFLAFKMKQEEPKKDFLLLSSLWLIITFGMFFSVAYDIAPRFWLLVAGLPFVFLGLFFELFFNFLKDKRLAFGLVFGLTLLFVVSNATAIKKRFWQLSYASSEAFNIEADRILKERDRTTLEQFNLIIDYIQEKHEENNWPVYLNSEAFYRRSLLYLVEKRGILEDDFRNVKTIYREGNYFLVYPTLSNWDNEREKYLNDFNLLETKNFGTMTVWRLQPKETSITAEKQEFEPKGKPTSAPGVPIRYRWEEIFSEEE